MKRLALMVMMGLVLAGGTPAGAVAADATQRGYDGDVGGVLTDLSTDGAPAPGAAPGAASDGPGSGPATDGSGDRAGVAPRATSSTPAGQLPFTGLEMLLVAGLGALLAGTGVVLRRTAGRAGA